MLQINFYPDYDNPDFIVAVEEYQKIWETEKENIVKAFKKTSGLEFKENYINAVVFSGISHSHPLSLRYDFPDKFKKANLVHELGHRLLRDVNRQLREQHDESLWSLELHKALDLVLFDVFVYLWGEEYAKQAIEFECNPKRPSFYKVAWDWALSFSREEKQEKFKELLNS